MKIGRVAVVGVAVAAGLAAAFLARNLISTPKPAAPVTATEPAIPTSSVLVAARDLPMGSSAAVDAFRWQAWPQDSVPQMAIQQSVRPNAPQELAGSIAKGNFFAGEPINEQKLIHSDRGYMSAILPAGMRAVATTISVDTSAGGFILPNDRVDVLMTRKVDSGSTGNGERVITEPILSNVRVLAIDQTIGEKDGQKVVVGQTATLELTSNQVEILTTAQQMGQRLTLALRSLADSADRSGQDAVHLIQSEQGTAAIRIVRGGVTKQIITAE